MNLYLNLFIDKNYPKFLDKYLATKTMKRLKDISQFCGCDYTKLYNPLFFYSRFDHSLVVAHMTWHFTHDKKETIAALLHDIGTPCFAHTIDYVFEDYLNQESSEKDIVNIIKKDFKLLKYLEEDGILLDDLKNLTKYSILENKSPRLCTDRLDGVLHTCYIWLHTHSIESIKEVYDDIIVLKNEDEKLEIGFKNQDICQKFVNMTIVYAKELQGNKDKYVMKYICEIIKEAVLKKLINIDDLYIKKEKDVVDILANNFSSWQKFKEATLVLGTALKPDYFYISFQTKKRNVIPLLKINNSAKRIIDVSEYINKQYLELENYQDTKYAYVESIKNITD